MTNQDSGQPPITIAQLLQQINTSWRDLQDYLASLTETQMTVPSDAAGWTVKDHLIHLTVWEDGIYALLCCDSRLEAMGFEEGAWEMGIEAINAAIQQRYHNVPLAEAQQMADSHHRQFLELLSSMSDEDLLRPYQHYDPNTERQQPVYHWVLGNSAEHYAEHLPWMQAIVAASPGKSS